MLETTKNRHRIILEEDAGMEVIIVDSISQEWEWCLEEQLRLGGQYQHWKSVTPRHDAFKNAILQSKCHVITTVRRKQDYDMSRDGSGKSRVTKLGLKEVTRDGWDYELTLNLELDVNHFASAAKDRTGLFMGRAEFVPTADTGRVIRDWCDGGVDYNPNDPRGVLTKDGMPDAWAKAVKYLADGGTIDKIESKYQIAESVRQGLFSESLTLMA